MKTMFLLFLFLFFLISPLSAEDAGEDILSFMINLNEELQEEYQIWLQSRIIYAASNKYRRSVEDVLQLYHEIFPGSILSSQDHTAQLKVLGFEKQGEDWYYEGEMMGTEGRLFTASEVVKAYREINFGDSQAAVREKLKSDLGYTGELLMPEISITGVPFLMSFSFYQDQLYQVLIQHKETRFTDDIYKFWDGVNFQNILYQVISSQYGEPSFSQKLTLSLMEPPYDGRVAWSSVWGPEKTGGEKKIRIGINYVSYKATLLIEYLPLAAEKEGISLIKAVEEMQEEERLGDHIQEAGEDF